MNELPLYDQLSQRHFGRLAAFIETNVGIRLPPSKRTMVEGRLRKRVRALGLPNLNAYCDHLFDDNAAEDEFVHLIDLVTTNKTDFFREPDHFEFLASQALPNLLGHRSRRRESRIKVWSAACSNGAEVYTIAMVLADQASRGESFQFAVLGTDICTDVLQQAALAVYPVEMMQPVPAEMLRRFVLKPRNAARGEVRIAPELRRLASFRRLNLMDASYPFDRDIDVIFCRNILIYFERATQRAVLERLIGHLRPGGYLFLGHSESAAGTNLPHMQQEAATIFRRR